MAENEGMECIGTALWVIEMLYQNRDTNVVYDILRWNNEQYLPNSSLSLEGLGSRPGGSQIYLFLLCNCSYSAHNNIYIPIYSTICRFELLRGVL